MNLQRTTNTTQPSLWDQLLPKTSSLVGGTTRLPHAELGFFIGGVAPIGVAQRLPAGPMRVAASVVIGVITAPTSGALGALLGAGYDLGLGVVGKLRSDT